MSKTVTFTTSYNRAADKMTIGCMHYQKPSKVKKSLSYAVDINEIYKQYCKTGNLPLNGAQPIYDENFVAYNDLIQSMDIVNQATNYFAGLPAEIKNQYGNSLPNFIKALNNKDQFLIDKGLLVLPKSDVSDLPSPSPSPVNPENPVVDSVSEKSGAAAAVNTAPTDKLS